MAWRRRCACTQSASLYRLAALVTVAALVYLLTKGEERVIRLARRLLARIPRVREDAAEPVCRPSPLRSGTSAPIPAGCPWLRARPT